MKKLPDHIKDGLRMAGLERGGCEFSVTGRSHVCIRLPNGRRVVTSRSPSCCHASRNLAGDIRRAMARADAC